MKNKEWISITKEEREKQYFLDLEKFLEEEYGTKNIAPKKENIYKAFNKTPFSKIKVVILGQDPYPTEGVADGMAFSTNNNVETPKSLVNIKKVIEQDFNKTFINNSLENWAEQGVFLLNTVLTVECKKPNSHRNRGWETFTDFVIKKISEEKEFVVFILLGNNAQKKENLINKKHKSLKTSHPSPLSCYRGFMESEIFKKANEELIKKNLEPIEW